MFKVVNSPFTFCNPEGDAAIEWYVNAAVEDREAFLHAIGGYEAYAEMWYVYSDKAKSDHVEEVDE